jgi:microcystin-dependent protein
MSQPYVGEIRMFGGNFPPAGWMFCSGQLLPISEYETLFNLIGTTYGGDGQETFALPDLQGRLPVHSGTGLGLSTYQIGEKAGVETVTLTQGQMPQHTHPFLASTDGENSSDPTTGVVGQVSTAGNFLYFAALGTSSAAAQSIAADGGSQPHENLQPFLCISFIISLFGVFPSQN